MEDTGGGGAVTKPKPLLIRIASKTPAWCCRVTMTPWMLWRLEAKLSRQVQLPHSNMQRLFYPFSLYYLGELLGFYLPGKLLLSCKGRIQEVWSIQYGRLCCSDHSGVDTSTEFKCQIQTSLHRRHPRRRRLRVCRPQILRIKSNLHRQHP